jgi:alcohol dehydrogenase class IV
MSDLSLSTIPSSHIPEGMQAVHVGEPFLSIALKTISDFGARKVFVLANKSSRKFIEHSGDGDGEENTKQITNPLSLLLIDKLREMGILAAPLNTSLEMGGMEDGLLRACNEAYVSQADLIITIGGGAVQDAGKLVRLWLSTRNTADDDSGDGGGATVEAIQAAANRNPMPILPPQIAIPNSFAMAEGTHVAGLTTSSRIKSGVAHSSMLPTVIIYDPALSSGLPDWVRFGTALRGVEHAVGAITHPNATEDIRSRALLGLSILHDNLIRLISNPECPTTNSNTYVGGFIAVRALSPTCYPSIGHLIENLYSAKFNVHQGSCSGILMARIMDYHYEQTKEYQKRVSIALCGGNESTSIPAPILIRDLIRLLPGVKHEHDQVNVTNDMLRELTTWMFANHLDRYNVLCPRKFASVEDIYEMMTKSLDDL